jgi:SNF2 family DNA or RNA helicase
MKIIHGIWTPENNQEFVQDGQFSIWIETDERTTKDRKIHPHHLQQSECADFLKQEFAYNLASKNPITLQTIKLPTYQGKPLPAPELAGNQELDDEAVITLEDWQVYRYVLLQPLKEINQIHFLSSYQTTNTRMGSDFLFWHYFSQSLKIVLYKDQYIPALLAQETRGQIQFYRHWKIISPQYEALIRQAVTQMPLACSVGYQPETLLRHFAQVCLGNVLEQARRDLPQTFNGKILSEFLGSLLFSEYARKPLHTGQEQMPTLFRHYLDWQQRLSDTTTQSKVQLGLQLHEATAKSPNQWRVEFILCSHQDPSFKLGLSDFWQQGKQLYQTLLEQQFGTDIEQQLLMQLAQAAKIYLKLWQGMETSQPDSVYLTLEEAFEFIKEQAWILEDAGLKIIVPAWLTPKGRQRAKLRLRSSKSKSSSSAAGIKSYVSLENLVNYHYELAIGDEVVSVEEWQQLIESKVPLVQFRGQWVELDHDKMAEMLQLWQQQQHQNATLSVQELLKTLAEQNDTFVVSMEDSLATMLEKLNDNSKLEPIDDLPGLNATLREYQKRGVAWLRYLESLGLSGCLADDMGLGKTMQVIALLLLEKNTAVKTAPTLLIAPTSVLGNWQKEVEKFAPQLKTLIHHGNQRQKNAEKFTALCQEYDMVISSYTLMRKDLALFKACPWQRLVLDEAQNIKNPKTAQTKALTSLEVPHRLALTGTPVENRLMDLWSIFNFLNPGYLGKQAQFRKNYELPVQRDNDEQQSMILKKLVQPFILRRLKTDKNIIKDLPDKIESKQYCNLSKEQASLYEAVIKEVDAQLDAAEGIARQGLMLSTLMKLKQICNHPMQFLQDGSAFTPERSHKLERLSEMLEEALEEGDSVLIFTQFTEIGENLHRYLHHEKHYPTYYLHGGTSRKNREQMISNFQNPEALPSIFVLSLKAGGVGITLTQANHVFHFDRWWNPSVENQATDRAFRIGQQKNVFVHKFVTLGTLEERIDQMIEDKQKIADSIIGSDENWLTQLDNHAFRQLIALNQQSVMED